MQVYYRCITGVLQVYYRCITGVLQVYYRCITGVLQVYYVNLPVRVLMLMCTLLPSYIPE